VKELTRLADVEKMAFEKMPAVSQYGSSGDESTQAHDILEDAADPISNHSTLLAHLADKSL
jgi:hypothetical protein